MPSSDTVLKLNCCRLFGVNAVRTVSLILDLFRGGVATGSIVSCMRENPANLPSVGLVQVKRTEVGDRTVAVRLVGGRGAKKECK